MQALAPALGTVGIFVVIGWMFQGYLRHRRILALAQARTEMQTRLLDRFQATPDLLAFLDSAHGQPLLEAVTTEKVNPRGRIMASVQTGMVVSAAGTAMMATAESFQRIGPEAGLRAVFFSSLILAIGLGFLGAALVLYLLAKKWKMLGD